ncbi:MAG TPA: hypothetical protein VFN56_00880 [Candidatus Saccharimonadales bacterium]|nr:hypothetical protein [Candidatus Saccharimonadales bacterium]
MSPESERLICQLGGDPECIAAEIKDLGKQMVSGATESRLPSGELEDWLIYSAADTVEMRKLLGVTPPPADTTA